MSKLVRKNIHSIIQYRRHPLHSVFHFLIPRIPQRLNFENPSRAPRSQNGSIDMPFSFVLSVNVLLKATISLFEQQLHSRSLSFSRWSLFGTVFDSNPIYT